MKGDLDYNSQKAASQRRLSFFNAVVAGVRVALRAALVGVLELATPINMSVLWLPLTHEIEDAVIRVSKELLSCHISNKIAASERRPCCTTSTRAKN